MGGTLYTFNGGGTNGLWTDASIWTTDPTGSTSINSRVPANGDAVVITNSFVVYVNSAISTTGLDLTIQRGGVLDLQSAAATFATLNSLSGQGTLRIAAPFFPAVTTNNFDDANTGTVEFYNWATGPSALPIPVSGMYNNLRLLNTSTAAYGVLLDANLTVNGSMALSRTNTTSFPNGSTYATAAAAAAGAGISFKIGLAAANRTLNVYGLLTVGNGTFFGVNNANNGVHVLNIYNDFINNGTINLRNASDAQVVQVAFRGTTDTNFACNGDTDLDIMVVNKGFDSQVLLNVTSAVGLHGSAQGNLRLNHTGAIDMLQLFNGVAKLGNNVYLAKVSNDAANGFSLGEDVGGGVRNAPTLWIAGATVLNDNMPLIAVYGIYRISAGSFTSKNDAGMVVREDGQVLIEGGTTLVNKFRPSRTSANHRGSFIISNGLFECTGTTATSVDDKFARFCVPYLTQAFRMTGGTIRTQVPNPNGIDGIFHIGVAANNAIVTGGTIEIILPATNINGKFLSTAPLWNLTVIKSGAAGTSKVINQTMPFDATFAPNATTAGQPLVVQNDFILDATNPTTFDAGNLNLTIQGGLNIGTGCTYLPGTNTTIFSGTQNQLLTTNGTIGTTAGVGTFNNWTVDKAAGILTLAGSVGTYSTLAGTTLSILRGVLNDAGKTINVQGNLVNSAFHQSVGTGSITMNGAAAQTIGGDGTGVFGNLKVLNTGLATGSVAVTLANSIMVTNQLTLQSTHVMAIGSYRLSLTNVNTNALLPTNGFSSQRMIQTAGNASDLGLQKTYGGAQAFTFPVGTGTKYTPAVVDLQLATALSQYGQISVSPANVRNPFVASTTNSLAYYWKVRSTGFGAIPSGAIYETFTMTNADAAGYITSPNNYVGGRYLPTSWNTSFSTAGSVSNFGTTSDIAFSGMQQFDGEFTAGLPATFGPITSYYSMRNGNWTDTNLATTPWSTTGPSGPAVSTTPGPGNPVFIGSAGTGVFHTVTVIANTAKSGSLVIDRGSVLDVGTFTGHNFGALPDSKIGGSGRLRISSGGATAAFPSGDFGSFIQYGGGTVEYYTTGTQNFTLPTTNGGSLTLNQYRNLWLNAATGRTITLPNQDLRVHAQLKSGSNGGVGTVLISSAAAGNIRVDSLLNVQNGIFQLQGTNARTLALDTDVKVDAGAAFNVLNNAATTHNVTVGGSFTNNGSLDFLVGTGRANLTFTGGSNNGFTGPTGTLTNLNTLTVNKGLGRTATLTLDVAGTLTTPTSNWLTLTNGTLRYAKGTGTLTIHDAASPYLITDNAGLTVDAPNAVVTVATNTGTAADLKLAGEVRVLQGTLNVGTTSGAGNDLEYASAGAPTLKVTAGTLYVNGQIRRSVNNLDGSLRFDQSGGAITIDGQGATAAQNNERGLFEVQGLKSIFRMSGGTINLRRSNGRPTIAADFYLAPDSTVVTGGTVVLGNAAAGVGNVTISVNSAVPIFNLLVESGATAANSNTGLLTGVSPLTLNGSLTIGNGNSFFNANSLGLNVKQNLNNNNTLTVDQSSVATALTTGGFLPGSTAQTTTFLGAIPTQFINGAGGNVTVFGKLVLNHAQTTGTLRLNGTVLTAGNLTLTKGTLDDNGNTITVWGDVSNSTVHTGSGSLVLGGTTNQSIGGNGAGQFGNLTLNNAAGATTTANQEVTQVLSLSNGILSIGSNLLWMSSTAANNITGGTATRFIRTNGIVADLGLRKSYPAGSSGFGFPLGVGSKYTPVQLNLSNNTVAGTVTVQAIDLAHPSTTDPANKELKFFWKISTTGLSASATADQQFTYSGADVQGNEANYLLGRFLNGAWTPANGITTSSVNTTFHTLLNLNTNIIAGDYTGGEPSEFGSVPVFYSRNATAGLPAGAIWTTAAAWTFNANGTDSSPLPTTFPAAANPVVILPTHLITTTANGMASATLKLDGTLDLGVNVANNFNTVSGTGTLKIGSALFPAGNYAGFVAANTGTVEFTGKVQLPARDTYNNLILSGGSGAAKQLTNLDLTLNGALNITANTAVDNPTSQNVTLNSATSGATVSGTFTLNDGKLTTASFLNTTSTGSFSFGAGAVSVGTSLTNDGMLVNGSAPLTVATTFTNNGTVDASAATSTGLIGVDGNFINASTYTAGIGNLNVTGTITNTTTGIFTAGTGEVNAGMNFINGGAYTAAKNIMHVNGEYTNQSTGFFDAANSNIVFRGNFTNTTGATFAAGTSLVQFITDVNRFINGNTTFYDLQKLSSSALTFGPNTTVHVANLMTIQNSVIFTGINTGNTLYLDNPNFQPIVGNTLTSYVAGRLAMALPNEAAAIRVFPVGAGQRYRPVTIKPLGISTGNPVVLVEIINGAAPNANAAGNVAATLQNIATTRYYRIQLLSGTLNQPTVQLSFNTDVEDEKVNVPGNLRVARSNGPNGQWDTAGGSGVFSPDAPKGYTTSAGTVIDGNSYFVLASTNKVDNPLSGSAPLPVTLVNFSATRQGSAVQVAWATASEKNSDYFVVERSANGRTFDALTRIEAQGSSTARFDYSTLDRAPLGGTSYYRLRQVDKDGATAYSNIATVRFEGKVGVPSLVAFPNPATGNGFQLATANLAPANGTVRVFDNVGRLVFTQTVAAGTAEATVQPARPLASGMYFATWTTADGVKLTTKVSVE
ncbi:hypothetical protein GCM10022409_16460 [Hymenobacter glaciei]|uniref:Secretion system C-terminal sorting domain-containing protein n=2 Tax=Hymenobacter glaciei TaxID=877209 RepID=A0ABP7TXU1_9BACT